MYILGSGITERLAQVPVFESFEHVRTWFYVYASYLPPKISETSSVDDDDLQAKLWSSFQKLLEQLSHTAITVTNKRILKAIHKACTSL